ncbi:MAG: hypothetical protein ACP5UQ_04690, partial [Anaerolineae bacterium]
MSRHKNNRSRGGRGLFLALIVGFFLCVLAFIGGIILLVNSAQPPNQEVATRPANANTAVLTIAYSPEKAALLEGLVAQFNGRNLRTPDRQPMKVELIALKPDEMVEKALVGQADFQALTPDSSLWLDQLNSRYAQAQQTEPGAIPPRLAGEGMRYAVTPIVIAAWEESARGLGWPKTAVSWTTLQTRAQQDPNFKWNHPSTAHASGLLATLAEFYAGAGVQRGLTAEMAQDPKTLAFVNAV